LQQTGARMAHYRIFVLTKVGEHIARSPLIVEHRDDAPAIEAAKQLLDGSNIVEVWEGARVVMRLDSTIAEKRPQPRIAC
jgi:hypothetical protein